MGAVETKVPKPGDLENQPEIKLQKRWFSFLLSKKVPPIPSEEERPEYPERSSNPISLMMFWWMNSLFQVGYKRTIHEEDLWKLDDPQKIDVLYEKFKFHLTKSITKEEDKFILKKCLERNESIETSSFSRVEDLEDFIISKSTIIGALWKTLWFDYSTGVVLKGFSDAANALAPLLQKKLTNFVEYRVLGLEDNVGSGVGYAIGCCLLILFSGITINFAFYRLMMTGGKCRCILTRMMLEKSMTMNAQAKHKFPSSQINNIMSTDLNRIDFGIGIFSLVFCFPVSMIIAIVLLLVNIGVSALVGLGAFLVLFAILGFSFSKLVNLRKAASKFTDIRVKLIKELLKNFKMIKFYSWESSYQARIENARILEMKHILKMQGLRNILIAVSLALPNLASMSAFLVMYKISNGRTAGDVFSSLSLFQIVAIQFMLLPMALATAADAKVGFERISKFMSSKDINSDDFMIEALNDDKLAIEVVDASFEWDHFDDEEGQGAEDDVDLKKNVDQKSDAHSNSTSISDEDKKSKKYFSGLSNIDFSINKGEFIVVTGSIGSGKSSLLCALAGFMKRTEGSVHASSKPLLCGYPWIKNATIRENILFGRKYDSKKYDEVVNACSLINDFKQFEGGDLTEVGERGITLSGGQKARINLARAVYADHDIILLDDVLSAVDAKVGRHIVDSCFLGLLKDKTRVLATHQLSLINDADRMIFMNGDGSISVGEIEYLKANNPNINQLFQYQDKKKKEIENEETLKQEEYKNFQEEKELLKQETKLELNEKEVKIIADEEKAVNGFGLEVYMHYLSAGFGAFGVFFLPMFVSFLVFSTFCNYFSNTWLSFWIDNKFDGRSKSFYEGLYIMFTFLYAFFLVFECIAMGYFTNSASKTLNIMATRRILKVPMSFMDVSPMGRVLNRFTKDTDVLDNEIIEQLRMAINPTSNIVATFILCIIYLPWFAIAVPVVIFIYATITSYYQATSREIKRIDAVKRSFVYSHFNETLSGQDTIKAYNRENEFLEDMTRLMDNQNEAFFLTLAAQRWLGSNLTLVTMGFVLIIALLCCFRVFNIGAASTGLLLTYAMNIPNLLSLALRAITQVENEFNSVERLNHYAYDLMQEAPHEIPENDPPTSWPQSGGIMFENVNMKYRPELPHVLKNVNINIKPHEKIGFCGRTGAGKSTVMTCLYRLTEFEGKIIIDDVDISNIGLHSLRSKLTIIPQDPVLFVGTIRSNLDPFNEHSDDSVWNALVTSGLIKADELAEAKNQTNDDENMHKFHLLRLVEDDGTNFSLGERQLIALARALVRKTKILILDEATSSVDYETDALIQKTIASEFSDCTILSIAHRLKTIVNYDRIVVMDKGEIVEFDTPLNLFKNGGIFRSMCDQSGIVESEFA